jgi:hypothetical protein
MSVPLHRRTAPPRIGEPGGTRRFSMPRLIATFFTAAIFLGLVLYGSIGWSSF